MKKFLSAILVLLSTAMVMAASPALTLYEGNIDNVELFAPDGSTLDVLSDIDASGFVIVSEGDEEVFSSPFGKLYLTGDTILAVTGFTSEDPSLYLISGRANVVLESDMRLSFYTPTTRTTIEGEGEYAFVSTDAEESFMNYSDFPAVSYDAMRAVEKEVAPMHELRYAQASVTEATQASYYSYSVLCDRLVYDEAEIAAEPEEQVVVTVPEEEAEEQVVVTMPEEDAEETGIPETPAFIEPILDIDVSAVPSAPVLSCTSWITETNVPSAPVLSNEAWLADSDVPSSPAVSTESWISSAETQAEEETSDEPLISFALEIGARYPLNWNKADVESDPVLLVTPSVTIGRGDWQIGLRAPLQMAFTNGPFRLVGFSGRELWDFGTGSGYTKEESVFHAVTDSFAIIDHLYLGNPEQTIAYIRAESDFVKNGTVFSSFGYEDGLALRLGFNFPNLAFRAYLSDAQAPHIGELQFSFYPFVLGGASLSLEIPFEMVFRDSDSYMLTFFPAFRLDMPFADHSFVLSAFAVGTVYTNYNDGELETSQIIYDFQEKAILPFMVGGEIKLDIDPVSVTVKGGYRKGILSPEYFNEFSAATNETIADKVVTDDNGTAVFASLSLGLDFGVFGLGLSYSANDLLEFSTDPMDVARLWVSVDAADMVTVYGSFSKRNLVTGFKNDFDAAEFFTGSDTLFTLGVDLDFGMFGLTAEARTVHLPTGRMKNGSVNIHELTDESYLQFKLIGRVEF